MKCFFKMTYLKQQWIYLSIGLHHCCPKSRTAQVQNQKSPQYQAETQLCSSFRSSFLLLLNVWRMFDNFRTQHAPIQPSKGVTVFLLKISISCYQFPRLRRIIQITEICLFPPPIKQHGQMLAFQLPSRNYWTPRDHIEHAKRNEMRRRRKPNKLALLILSQRPSWATWPTRRQR